MWHANHSSNDREVIENSLIQCNKTFHPKDLQ